MQNEPYPHPLEEDDVDDMYVPPVFTLQHTNTMDPYLESGSHGEQITDQEGKLTQPYSTDTRDRDFSHGSMTWAPLLGNPASDGITLHGAIPSTHSIEMQPGGPVQAEHHEEQVALHDLPKDCWDSIKNKPMHAIMVVVILGIFLLGFMYPWLGEVYPPQETTYTILTDYGNLPIVGEPTAVSVYEPLVHPLPAGERHDVLLIKILVGDGACSQLDGTALDLWINIAACPSDTSTDSLDWKDCPIYSSQQVDVTCDEENERLQAKFSMDTHVTNTDQVVLLTTNATLLALPVIMEVQTFGSLYKYQPLLAGIILLLVYIGIFSGKLHRALWALFGAVAILCVLTGYGLRPEMKMIMSWVDEATLALLTGMMIMVELLGKTGVLGTSAVYAAKWTKGRPFPLLLVICGITGISSAFLPNITAVLLVSPVTVKICSFIKQDPVPFLVCLAIFSNIGGAMTMVGDPPNLIIAGSLSRNGINFITFITNCGLGCMFTFPALVVFLRFRFPGVWHAKAVSLDIDELLRQNPIKSKILLYKMVGLLSVVILLMFLSPVHKIDVAFIAIIGAFVALLITVPNNVTEVLTHSIEWDTLFYLAGLFILMEGCNRLGLLDFIGNQITALIKLGPPSAWLTLATQIILWVSSLLSMVVDNTAYTITMIRVITVISLELQISIVPMAWCLSLGACLGGNGTIVGSSANVVAVSLAEKAGFKIGAKRWMSIGIPIVILQTAILSIFVYIRYVVMA